MPLLADPDGAPRGGRAARRVRRAPPARRRPRRGGARVHPRRSARLPARLRASSPPASPGKLPWRDRQRRSTRSSTAWTRSSSTPTRSATGTRVLIHDDLLATGGTAQAKVDLVEQLGGVVVGLAFVIELEFLNGRERLAGYDVHSLIQLFGASPFCRSRCRRRSDVRRTALGATVSVARPAGQARVRLSALPALERLPGAAHPAVYQVTFSCPCGDEHDGLVSHDELDWAPLGAVDEAFLQPDDAALESAAPTLLELAAPRIGGGGRGRGASSASPRGVSRPVFPSPFGCWPRRRRGGGGCRAAPIARDVSSTS